MNIKVMYHSSTGNTKKLAQSIAASLHVEAEELCDAPASFAEPVDLLFIGDGIYFGKPSRKTDAFIDSLTPDTVKHAAVFASYGGQTKIGGEIKSRLEGKGIEVPFEPYISKGEAWMFLNRRHPNDSDLNRAKEFARNIAQKLEG